MWKLFKRLAGLLVLLAVVLAVFEFYLVWRADQRSEAVLTAALNTEYGLKLSDLSERQENILLTVEDPAFYSHKGVDFSSPGQGLTTISQALVKRLYFSPFKPGFAKLEQSLIARFVLNARLSKQEQLLLFINLAYLGEHSGTSAIGFAAGARAVFEKEYAELTEKEFLTLVAMLIGPNRYNLKTKPKLLSERTGKIERLLAGDCKPTGLRDVWYAAC